jgi:photosystem II stability/assembly factor-like uncharacterized protein
MFLLADRRFLERRRRNGDLRNETNPKMMRSMRYLASLLILCALFTAALTRGHLSASASKGDEPSAEAEAFRLNWLPTGPSGDVRALVVDPNNPQRFYFGTLDGQIYTSGDGGQSWRMLVNFNRPKLFVDNLIVDPRDSRVIYVATHRHKEPGGFFKTKDGGQTWRESTELKNEAIHSMTQSAGNQDMLLVGTNDGVWRSMDAGESWSRLPTSANSPTKVESLAIDPRDPNTIYAGTWYLPYKTTDGGSNWNIIKTGIIDDSDVFAIDIDPRDPDHIFASACSGIYETKNRGEQWRKVQGIPSQSRRTRAILQHPTIPGLVFAGTTEGFWRSANGGSSWMLTTSKQLEINSIAVHPSNPQTVYIGTNNYGVMVSNDAGKTFVPTNGGYSGRFANFILQDRETPSRIYATTINTATGGGFFFISENGGMSWQPSMRNMPNRLISYAILQDETDANIIYLGTNFGIYRSLDRGASWSPMGAPAPEPQKKSKRRSRGSSTATAAPKQSQDVVKRAQEALNAAGYDTGTPDGQAGTKTVAAIRKFQTANRIPVSGKLDAATLTALGLGGGIQITNASGQLVSAVYLADPVNALVYTYDQRDGRSGFLAATNAGLYRTYNLDQGWEKLSYGEGIDARTTCLSTSPQDPRTIWAGTATSGVVVSRDGGETWQQVAGIPATAPINTIVQDRQRAGNIFVGTKQTLYLSQDNGLRWMRRGGGLPYGDYTSVLINPHNGNEIFIGNAYETTGGVYRSANGGMTWSRIDPQDARLPSQRIWALAYDANDRNRIFVGSHSAGIYVAEQGSSASLTSEQK